MPSYQVSKPEQLTIGKKTVTIVQETPDRTPEERKDSAIQSSVKIHRILKTYIRREI